MGGVCSRDWQPEMNGGYEPDPGWGWCIEHRCWIQLSPGVNVVKLFFPWSLTPGLHETAQIGLIFAVRPIFASTQLMDIRLHKIGWRDRNISISKIGRTAWQNQLDVTKIGSATVHVNKVLLSREHIHNILFICNWWMFDHSRLERLDRDKHTSLLSSFVSWEEEK